jgi:hypothetical protein
MFDWTYLPHVKWRYTRNVLLARVCSKLLQNIGCGTYNPSDLHADTPTEGHGERNYGMYIQGARLATGWTVRVSNPGVSEIFRTRPHWPWGPPSLIYNGYRVFPGDNAVGAWRWPPTLSSTEVKERAELYLYSSSGPSWPVLGWTVQRAIYFGVTDRELAGRPEVT